MRGDERTHDAEVVQVDECTRVSANLVHEPDGGCGSDIDPQGRRGAEVSSLEAQLPLHDSIDIERGRTQHEQGQHEREQGDARFGQRHMCHPTRTGPPFMGEPASIKLLFIIS